MSKPRSNPPPTQTSDPIGLLGLHVIAFIGGAAVMVLEIIGTRVIGPIFGVTLFVWAALLSVTLASLATGYYAGGVIVDRRPERSILAAILSASGLLIILSSLLATVVLKLALSLGARLGPMVSAALLFGPALTTLGMLAPTTIRLSANDPKTTGHRAGSISAVSTAGSLVATCATAFLLIPSFETASILRATAALLLVTGVATAVRYRKQLAVVALVLSLLPNAISRAAAPAGFEVLAQAQSAYGLVQVIDDSARQVRLLRSDHSIIGAAYTNNSHASPFEYIDVLESVRCMRPKAAEILQLGLGTGTLATVLREHGAAVDVVEIDPNVVLFAGNHFGYANVQDVVVEDARTWLQTATRKYDIVIHDTFTGGATPEHLLSIEALTNVRRLLRPGGVLAVNFVGYTEGDGAAATWALARTVGAVLKNYRIYRDDASDGELANVIIFASDDSVAWAATASDTGCDALTTAANGWKVVGDVPPGVILRDAANPIAQLHMPAASEHFRLMNELLPVDVWLNTSAPR